MAEVRTRFAPSPTGFMHVGNLRTALYEYLVAKSQGGKFVLRIEDTDRERLVEGAQDVIYKTLEQVGLQHDEGPDVGGAYGPYIQSQRKDLYKPYAQQLVKEGKAYYCFCTKERLESLHNEEGIGGYDRHCRDLPQEEVQQLLDAGTPYVIRQKVPLTGSTTFEDAVFGSITIENKEIEDQVLLKADGYPTYNFANVIDDHTMGITHVMRGSEYLSSAPKYNLLYQAFGWTPPIYVHLPVVMRDATRKLSKRYGDPSFEDLLDQGYLQEAIINFIALLGWSPRSEREFFTLAELEKVFDLEGLNKSPSIFDMNKLTWFNGEYIRKLSPEQFLEKARPWLEKALDPDRFDFPRIAQLLHTRTEVLSQIPQMVDFLAQMPAFDTSLYTHKKMKTNPEVALDALKKLYPVMEGIEDYAEQALHDQLMQAIPQLGLKTGQALWPLRIAISGKESTPGGAIEIAYLLGKEETLRRMAASIAQLEG